MLNHAASSLCFLAVAVLRVSFYLNGNELCRIDVGQVQGAQWAPTLMVGGVGDAAWCVRPYFYTGAASGKDDLKTAGIRHLPLGQRAVGECNVINELRVPLRPPRDMSSAAEESKEPEEPKKSGWFTVRRKKKAVKQKKKPSVTQ